MVRRYTTSITYALVLLALASRSEAVISGADTELAYLAGENRVMLINTVTGDREVTSGAGVGSGTEFVPPFPSSIYVMDVLIEDASNLIVCNNTQYYRVSRSTGDRTRLNTSPVSDGVAGSGDVITSIQWESPGVILALIYGPGGGGPPSRISRIDLSTMTGTVVSSPSVGTGTVFYPYASSELVLESATSALVVEFSTGDVYRVNTTTGDRTKVNPTAAPDYPVSGIPISSNEVLLGSYSAFSFPLMRLDLTSGAYTPIFYSGGSAAAQYASAMGLYQDGSIVIYSANAPQRLLRSSSLGSPITLSVVASASVGTGPALPAASYPLPASLRLVNPNNSTGVGSWDVY